MAHAQPLPQLAELADDMMEVSVPTVAAVRAEVLTMPMSIRQEVTSEFA